jgi:hypothetical protein
LSENTYFLGNMEIEKEKYEDLAYSDRVEYLLKKQIVITSLVERSNYDRSLGFVYECRPMIYVPTEKKWYGPDKLKEIIRKYELVSKFENL